MKYRQLNDIGAYRIAFDVSNYAWAIVMEWPYLAQQTLDTQFIRALDSISENVAEGFGRWGKKDRIRFYRYSSGSLYEALSQNEKAKRRGLLTEEQHVHILTELQKLPRELNALIKYTNEVLTI